MNIAILIPELGGGGAERVAQIIGDYYCTRGENVYYFLLETSISQVYPVKGGIINTGIKSCTEGDPYGTIQVLGKLLKSSVQMRKWKWKYHIDVAISFMEECNYINVLSKGRERVITRVCTILSQRDDFRGVLYNRYLVHFLYSLSNKIVVMSDYAVKDMHDNYGISYSKLQKIPNPALQGNLREEDGNWIYGKDVVICVGRLERVKQQEKIIRAFTYVISQHKTAKLLILGTGPNRKYLENLCKKNGIDQSVVFVGFTDDVEFYLKNSKVFVMASKVEGFPNSMVEAMAYGVPIVTTNSPGACSEIVGGTKKMVSELTIQYCKYGILTPAISGKKEKSARCSKEEVLLGDAILKVLKENELYDKYHKRSLKRAEMFHIDRVIKKWDKVVLYDRRKN